jgi:hypothetical protein
MFGSFSISLLALTELEAIFERPPYTGQDSGGTTIGKLEKERKMVEWM